MHFVYVPFYQIWIMTGVGVGTYELTVWILRKVFKK